MIPIFLSGFALGFSLILAIGAQNAFVLRQGIRRVHVLPVVLVCAVSDAILIAIGVAGFGALITAVPWVEPVARWGGALFLLVYGALSFRSAFLDQNALVAADVESKPLVPTLLTVLALSWLNPHVYLDTVILIGAVASQSDDRWTFGAGAITASFVFFFALGFGARLLQPVFSRPLSWRVLDFGVGILMWAIAFTLIMT